MITTEGKLYIKRYLAGWVPRIASSVAFGVGGRAESLSDTSLQFETDRSGIALTSFDFVNNRLVWKTEVPDNFSGTIYEMGIYSSTTNIMNEEFGSRLIVSFDSGTEAWYDPDANVLSNYSTSNVRIGPDALVLTPLASATARALLSGMFIDLSGYSNADNFLFAYTTSTNVSSVKFRFLTDATNYYEFTIATPGAGYRIDELSKGSAVVTGTPSWGSINMIEVRATATAGGAATITLDGIRVEDTDTPNPDYVLIARKVLPTPVLKEAGRSQTLEFAIDVAI